MINETGVTNILPRLRRVATTLLLWLLGLLGPRKPGPVPDAVIRRIVVFRFGGIGDVVTVTGLIRTLRQVFASAEITLVTTPLCAPVVKGNPDIDRVIAGEKIWLRLSPRRNLANLRRMRRISEVPYDLAFFTHNDVFSLFYAFFLRARHKVGFETDDRGFDFALTHSVPIPGHESPRTKEHERRHVNDHFHDLLRAFRGADIPLSQPRLYLSDSEVERARAWLAERRQGRPLLVLTPGGTEALKIWPIDHFAALAEHSVREFGASVLVLGGEEEARLADRFVSIGPGVCFAAGKLPLREAITLLSLADVVIGSDTGLIHAAAALGAATVTVFGPTPATVYGDQSERNVIFQAELDCVPCKRTVCMLLPPEAIGETPPCLAAIGVEEVVTAVRGLLTPQAASRPARP